MPKDLTTSRLDRQNILNNEIAVEEIQEKSGVEGVLFESKIFMAKEMVASFFEMDVRTIERYISSYSEELKTNGLEILKGNRLIEFIAQYNATFATDINVGRKIRALTVFDFRSFLGNKSYVELVTFLKVGELDIVCLQNAFLFLGDNEILQLLALFLG